MKLHQKGLAIVLAMVASGPAMGQTTETLSFTNLQRAIPDGNASGLSDHRAVATTIHHLTTLRVRLRIEGEFNGDLYAYLRHVDGNTTNFCVLLNRPGRTPTRLPGYDDSGLDILFDEAAPNGDIHTYRAAGAPPAGSPLTGAWRPDGRAVDPDAVLETSPATTSLSSFVGANPDGDWALFLADLESGGTNLLVSWELELTGPAVPEITWPTPADIVYGTALSPAQLNATTAAPGSLTYTPGPGTMLNAGAAQTLSVTFTPADTNQFVPLTTTVPLHVLPKNLVVTASDAAKLYGAPLPALACTCAGFVNGDTQASLDVPPSMATSATSTSPAGIYPISVAGASDPNYAITFVPGSLTVTPAPLTIAAVNVGKVYGAPLPELSATFTGFVNGDTALSLDVAPTLDTTATASSPAGAYPISVAGASDPNYAITFVPGSLTVTPAPLTIAAVDVGKVYGAPLPELSATFTGFVNGDTSANLDVPPTLTTTATASSPAGAYPISVAGAADANYSIAFVGGTLTINRAATTGLVGASPNPAPPGQPVTLTFALNAVPPGAGLPSGSVQFRVDGADWGGAATLVGGIASLDHSALAVGRHTVAAAYAGDANFLGTTNSLSGEQLINTSPVAAGDSIERSPTNGAKVTVVSLLSNDSDADGGRIDLLSVAGASLNGGLVTREGDWVYYTAPAGSTNDDAFTYTIVDEFGAQAVGHVVVRIRVEVVPSPNLVLTDLGNGSFLVRFDGIPGKTYRIESTDSLETNPWQTLGSGVADAFGSFQFTDTVPAGTVQRFYRSVYP